MVMREDLVALVESGSRWVVAHEGDHLAVARADLAVEVFILATTSEPVG